MNRRKFFKSLIAASIGAPLIVKASGPDTIKTLPVTGYGGGGSGSDNSTGYMVTRKRSAAISKALYKRYKWV